MSSLPIPDDPDVPVGLVGTFGITALAEHFHPDWWHRTVTEVVVDQLGDERNAAALRCDAARLIASDLTGDQLKSLWEAMACYRLGAEEGAARAWLGLIVSLCDAWQADHGKPPAPRCADQSDADGSLARAVSAEAELVIGADSLIMLHEQWDSTREEVVSALQRCSELVSAGLAFRILIGVIGQHRLRIAQEQYGRYLRLAAALSYSDELVEDIAYLIVED